jgi:hypothetical protein
MGYLSTTAPIISTDVECVTGWMNDTVATWNICFLNEALMHQQAGMPVSKDFY